MATIVQTTPFRRFVAGLLSVLMALGPVATPAYAALTPLADEPLATRNQAKPALLMTVDDSTSMLYDFLPDYVIDAYCRSGSGKMDAACGYGGSVYDFTAAVPTGGRYFTPGYIYQQYGVPFKAHIGAAGAFDASGPGAGCELVNPPFRCSTGIDPTAAGTNLVGLKTYPAYNATTNPTASPQAGKPFEYWLLWPAPVHNAALNKLYYNPRLTYDPPIGDDGNPLPNMNAANTSNWTQVPADPWASPVVNVDLTAKVTVGQWCNSDWTQGNDASGNPFVDNPALLPDQRHRRCDGDTCGRRRLQLPVATGRHHRRRPVLQGRLGQLRAQERLDHVQGERDGKRELLPERQRDLVQRQQHRVAPWHHQSARRPATCRRCRPARAKPRAVASASATATARRRRPPAARAPRRRPATGSRAKCATAYRRRPVWARSPRAAPSHRPAAPARRRPATRPRRPATTSRPRPATFRPRAATSTTRRASTSGSLPAATSWPTRSRSTASSSSSAARSAASAASTARTTRRCAPTSASAASDQRRRLHGRQRGDQLPDHQRHLQQHRHLLRQRR